MKLSKKWCRKCYNLRGTLVEKKHCNYPSCTKKENRTVPFLDMRFRQRLLQQERNRP